MTGSPQAITIFTDFASPHSWVTEAALRSIAADRLVEISYRALELHPAPAPFPDPAEVARWIAEAAPDAAAEGLTLGEHRFLPRTRKAHEAARFAAEHGLEAPLRNAIYRSYWDSGLDVGRIDVLTRLGEEVGLDPEDLKIALDIDRFGDSVRHDAGLARKLNVTVVPTAYIGIGPDARILVGLQTRRGLDAAIP